MHLRRLAHGVFPFTEFIHLISSEANEICEQESKKTIAPEHIIGALKVLLRIYSGMWYGWRCAVNVAPWFWLIHDGGGRCVERSQTTTKGTCFWGDNNRTVLKEHRTGRRKYPNWNNLEWRKKNYWKLSKNCLRRVGLFLSQTNSRGDKYLVESLIISDLRICGTCRGDEREGSTLVGGHRGWLMVHGSSATSSCRVKYVCCTPSYTLLSKCLI